MPRSTRVLVLLSLAVAVVAYVLSASMTSARDVYLAAVAGALAAAGARLAPRWTGRILLPLAFVAPGLLNLATAADSRQFHTLWLVPAAAWLIAETPLKGWSIPIRWQRLLVTWALVVAACWPIVFLRELDFHPSLSLLRETYSNGLARLPVAAWTCGVAAAAVQTLVGVLWLDRLCARFPDRADPKGVATEVLIPIGVGVAAACGVGIYQSWVDPTWLSPPLWTRLGRATGTLLDGNGLGAVAASWSVVLAGWLISADLQRSAVSPGAGSSKDRGHRLSSVALPALLLLVGCLAVFASGSRTAFAAFAIGALVLATAVARRTQLLAAVVAALALVLVLGGASHLGWLQAANPVRRLTRTLPRPTLAGVQSFARSMWARDGWGTASVSAIGRYPFTGVGPGTFTLQSSDFVYINEGRVIPPDNAQNWWRQQAAEFGLAGAGFAIVLTVGIVRLLWRRAPPGLEPAAGAVRGAIIGLAAASLFGVPTQVPAVSFSAATFLFLALWLFEPAEPRQGRRISRGGVVLVTALVGLVAAGQALAASHELRPPLRVLRVGGQYGYDFWRGGTGSDGRPFWWTGRRGVFVFPAERGVLEFIAIPMHPDIASRPVTVQVSLNGQKVLEREARDHAPIALRLPDRPGQRAVLIETRVDRTFRGSDGIERGLLIQKNYDRPAELR